MTAIESTTLTATAALAQSKHYFAAGDMQLAEEYCRESLRGRPDSADAFHLLGRIMHESGRSDIGIALLWKAIAAEPEDAQHRTRLGKMFLETDKLDESITMLESAHALDPSSGKALRILGAALSRNGNTLSAEHCYQQVLDIEPEDPRAYFHLANLYESTGRHDRALATFERAVELDPGMRLVHRNYARELRRDGRHSEAKHILQMGLAIIGYDPELAYMLRALNGDASVTRAPDDYVSQHFDQFAPFFDEQLVQRLDYQAPQLISGVVQKLWSSDIWKLPSLHVLDLGCGTGLCGELLRPLAHRLTGVDLSAGMLEKARDRRVYDDLVVAEITAYLSEAPQTYDLIAAADVLVYLGDLQALFASIMAALAPGGVFSATVERSDTLHYQLTTSGRYVHSDAYLRTLALCNGLHILGIEECTLRLEYGKPVHGYLGTFRKPSDP